MVRVGSYWKRRQLGPDHKGIGTPWELHMQVGVGEFVEVLPSYTRNTVTYVDKRNRSDAISERLFRMYFEEATKEEVILLTLAEAGE
jgi:hypothetical protein